MTKAKPPKKEAALYSLTWTLHVNHLKKGKLYQAKLGGEFQIPDFIGHMVNHGG